ncbi:MAG: hypothetical protein JSU01_21065 [Bacteroidetes bacterium]|nr:hypothetical protein [Bacteroidota bacterium]
MRSLFTFIACLLITISACAQKVDYKNNIISIDGKETAKVSKIKDKDNMRLTSSFEVYSMSGTKLVIAALATEFDNAGDNLSYYYRLIFLTANQTGVFIISKLSPERSFVKLLGSSGIFVNDDTDPEKVKEFIALKGKTPQPAAPTAGATDYTLVSRNRIWPIKIEENKTITQEDKIIGSFRAIPPMVLGYDSYEFSLPNGTVVAVVSFKDGNNAQAFDVLTNKDSMRRMVNIPTRERVTIASTPADKNEIALKRLVQWMVTKDYL